MEEREFSFCVVERGQRALWDEETEKVGDGFSLLVMLLKLAELRVVKPLIQLMIQLNHFAVWQFECVNLDRALIERERERV